VNFLAHCALGDRTDALLVGGYLGDFQKGPVPTDLPAGVRLGIRLHRRIDAFSGTEPAIRASIDRLPTALRRFAPPFVDLLADHFLAQDFERLHRTPLAEFSRRSYAAIDAHRSLLPPRALRFFEYMRDVDLFARYREFESVERAFERLMTRLGRQDAVAPLLAAAQREVAPLREDFARFYPALRVHADEWLAANGDACG
jgi:acyl carrier protein phosphodiesterase